MCFFILRDVLGERKLSYDPTTAGKIICSVAVLHNFIILNKFTDEYSNANPLNVTNPVEHNQPRIENNQYLNDGKEVRRKLQQSMN